MAATLWYPFRLVFHTLDEFIHHGTCLTVMMCLTEDVKTHYWMINVPIYTMWSLTFRKYACCQHTSCLTLNESYPLILPVLCLESPRRLILANTNTCGWDWMHNHEAPGKCFCSYKWLLLQLHPTNLQIIDYVHGITVEYNKCFAYYSIGYLHAPC